MTGKTRAAGIRTISVSEVRRMKHGVMQRPPRQRVLTVHHGRCGCSWVVTYVVPKSDNLMVHASEVSCGGESVAPVPPLMWLDRWKICGLKLQDRYVTSLDTLVPGGRTVRRRAMWLWNMAFSPFLVYQV